MAFKQKEVCEGETRLLVPSEGRLTRKDPVFYNPEMEFSRDLTIAAVKASGAKSFCDLLSGSGARGVRVANETGAKVLANDMNPRAFNLIKKNAELNSVEVEALNLDASRVLFERHFDFVDLDPFGSPSRFMDLATKAVDTGGILAVTATDTSALCGSAPRACLRKYDSLSLRTDYYNELGLRILIGFMARTAARNERGIRPLFSHCTRHYFRAYVEMLRGTGGASRTLKDVSFIQHCFSCRRRSYRKLDELESFCSCGARLRNAGPLWSGEFADIGFSSKLANEFSSGAFGRKKQALRLIEAVSSEQPVTLPYYDIHKVARSMKIPVRPMNEVVSALEKKGFLAIRTHFSGFGLRTDADFGLLQGIISCKIR